jgi:hypothetical protein
MMSELTSSLRASGQRRLLASPITPAFMVCVFTAFAFFWASCVIGLYER